MAMIRTLRSTAKQTRERESARASGGGDGVESNKGASRKRVNISKYAI